MIKRRSIKINLSHIWIALLVSFSIVTYKISIIQEIPVYRIMYIITFIFMLSTNKYKNSKMNNNLKKSIILWLIITLWGLISLIWINKTGKEINYIMYDIIWNIISICFSVYMINSQKKDKILSYYCIISTIIAIMGIYTGITGYYFNDTHISYHYNLNTLGLYKPNTIFYNINDNAVFMFTSIIALFLYTEKKEKKKIIRIIGTLLYISNIILVDSRGIELSLIIFLLIYFFATKKINIKTKIRISLLVIILLCIFSSQIMNLSIFKTGINDSSRISIIDMSLESLKKSYYLGVGPGNISHVNAIYNKAETYDTHNFFLEIFCDYGIVGAVAISLWYISNLKTAYIFMKKEKEAVIVLAALISMLCAFIVSSSLIGKAWFACFFGIIVAILNQIENKYDKLECKYGEE